MSKIKYRDEKYLCRYDLDFNLFKELGLDIIDLKPSRNVFFLETKQGNKILKMISYDEERLNFIIKVTEYLRRNYKEVLKINKLREEKYRIKWNENYYVLLDYFEGTEFNMANPIELEVITKAIGRLHKASLGFQREFSKEQFEKNSELFKLLDYFENSKRDLENLKDLVGKYKYKNEFDERFIREVDYHLNDIEKCIKLIRGSKYTTLCKDKEKVVLCHNDLAYHNILFNDGKVSFIDFDYCNINLRVIDLCNFIIKSIKKFGFSLEMYDSIINNYNEENPLSKEEKELIYIYLRFPHDFYTISMQYYYKLKDWKYESFLNKLERKLEYTKEKEILLKHIGL